MTGELCDAFPSRREGVAGLAAIAADHLAPSIPIIYAGRAGFVELGEAARHAVDIASANWHASAALVALRLPDALFIDIGSTTADLIPIVAGHVAAVGYSDAERLASGELVYTGLTRSFVMSIASRAPFRGAWTPLMNEYFASSADVHRILGDLPDGADKMATADGREKTVEASRARLARMIGREADEGAASEWDGLAAWFAERQMRQIADAVSLRLSRNDVPIAAPVVAAGVGEGIAAEVARRLRRSRVGFSSLIAGPPEASHCAPAVAVALIGMERRGLASGRAMIMRCDERNLISGCRGLSHEPSESRRWARPGQRLSDIRARRICLRLHENQRRYPRGAWPMLVFN